MIYSIQPPSSIRAIINLPASKSISNRALAICALMGDVEHVPDNLSDCDDTQVMISAVKDGECVIDIGAAGTAMRFMTACLAVMPGTRVITGTERMKHRPIGILVDALRRLGAHIEYVGEEGFPPLRITGCSLEGGYLDVPGSISSQYISALLMIGPMLERGLTLKLTGGITSRPYIDLTIHVMHDFGARVEWSDFDTIEVEPVPYVTKSYTIENDWSAASYWYEIMALRGNREDEITLTGLVDGSRQGDSVVRYIFSMLGVKTSFSENDCHDVVLRNIPTRLKRLEYDFKNQPDMAQTFVVSCALLGVPFRFTGLSTLRIKETDRIEAMKTEMRKIGYVISDGDGNELRWDGERCEPDAEPIIDTYDDHRMALAFAPAAVLLPRLCINNPRVVSKSYPHFWDDLKKAGFLINER